MFAALGTALAFASTLALLPFLDTITLPPFIAAIMLSAWLGGERPGLLATVLSLAGAAYLFFGVGDPTANPGGEVLRLALLGGIGVLCSRLFGSLKTAQRTAEEHSYLLEEQALEMELQAAELETTNQELSESSTRAHNAEQRYRELVEGVDAVVWEADPETGNFTYASPRAEAMFGHRLSHWMNDGFYLTRLVHPDDRDAVERFHSEVLAGGEQRETEYRTRTSDGRIIWVRETAALHGSGETRRLHGLLVDVTAQRAAERRANAEQHVSHILATSQDLRSAAPRILETIGLGLGWDVGLLWERADDEVLRCIAMWRDDAAEGEIERQSHLMTFRRGEGFLGQVWESGTARWSADVQREIGHLRASAAARDGLRAAFAFPVSSSERFIAVVEFFCHESIEPHQESIRTMTAIANQIGQFAERRRAESQLLDSAREMRALISAMTDVVVVLDSTGRYVTIAPSGNGLLSRPASELLGKRLHDVFDREKADYFLAELQKALRFGTPVNIDYSLDIGDRTVWFAGTISPMSHDRVVWVGRDITQRREAERQLLERSRFLALEAEIATVVAEEGTLRDILELSCEAVVRHFDSIFARVWMYDPKHRVLIQEASCGIATPFDAQFARTPVGTGMIGMIAQDREPHLNNEAMNDPRPAIREWARREGATAFAGYPLLAGDELLGVIATYSRQHLSQNALMALRSVADRLALVIQRHRAEDALRQTEGQLRQAQKMEAIGQLAGGVAHDFNNLLTVISSYSTMALEDIDSSSPLHADISEIHGAARRAAALTRQLLAFSRKQVLEPRVLDLNEIVTNLDRMLQRLIGEDIHLVLSLDEELGYINADPGQVEQVIINLAVNARDAMPGGGRLNLGTSNIELSESDGERHIGAKAGSYVMLAVSDTGTGMDDATLQRAFEPFFTTKGQGQGTGLGLSTVYGIVKQSEGDVWVYSEPGQGTTFKIFFPRLTEPNEGPMARTGEHRDSARGTELVLLVEDDEAVRTLAARVLRDQGYVVMQAADGKAALEIADSSPSIALVVTDVVMPRLSGRALVEGLAARHPGVRTLFMSGYTDDEVVRRGILDARTAFIQKPFTPASLAAKVREVLDANV